MQDQRREPFAQTQAVVAPPCRELVKSAINGSKGTYLENYATKDTVLRMGVHFSRVFMRSGAGKQDGRTQLAGMQPCQILLECHTTSETLEA